MIIIQPSLPQVGDGLIHFLEAAMPEAILAEGEIAEVRGDTDVVDFNFVPRQAAAATRAIFWVEVAIDAGYARMSFQFLKHIFLLVLDFFIGGNLIREQFFGHCLQIAECYCVVLPHRLHSLDYFSYGFFGCRAEDIDVILRELLQILGEKPCLPLVTESAKDVIAGK